MTNQNKVHRFMASPLGSLLKHFIFIVLSLWLVEIQEGHDLFKFDVAMWKKFITAGFVACMPVVMNWLNPKYKNYGK